jgi:hypothetical protein
MASLYRTTDRMASLFSEVRVVGVVPHTQQLVQASLFSEVRVVGVVPHTQQLVQASLFSEVRVVDHVRSCAIPSLRSRPHTGANRPAARHLRAR